MNEAEKAINNFKNADFVNIDITEEKFMEFILTENLMLSRLFSEFPYAKYSFKYFTPILDLHKKDFVLSGNYPILYYSVKFSENQIIPIRLSFNYHQTNQHKNYSIILSTSECSKEIYELIQNSKFNKYVTYHNKLSKI